MSCCPPAPPIVVGTDSAPNDGPEHDIRAGETIECFSKRAGNSTGSLSDATENRLEKIANESVVSDCKAYVSVQFGLTVGSVSRNVTYVLLSGPVPGLSFTDAGKLEGTITDKSILGTKVTIRVQANAGPDGQQVMPIDDRTYVFSPALCTGSDSIQFLLPLPGGTINSPFGMRMHPIQKINKLHTGIDLKIAPGVDGDVVAAADGEVIKAKCTDPRGYGNSIHIKHLNGAGKHLCTTTYNHLAKFYVQEGQKVMAGQKIAREGGLKGVPGSGGSTGLHLHFECKLPDGSFTDPAPYIRGAVKTAGAQTPEGEPLNVETKTSTNTAITPSNVDAKQGCQSVENYPRDPSQPEPPVGPPSAGGSTDAFELAWFFTMKGEVGPWWNIPAGTVPTDPEIVAGLCDTPAQRHKCGYQAHDKGGETKFGIAKSGNPATPIKTATYEDIKKIGFQNYWNLGLITPSKLPKYIGIFMFDTNYNHGQGNGRTIYADSGVEGVPMSASKDEQMIAVDKIYKRRLAFAQSLKRVQDQKGVSNRVNACYAYVKSLP